MDAGHSIERVREKDSSKKIPYWTARRRRKKRVKEQKKRDKICVSLLFFGTVLLLF